ncbi:MAG: MFS transporter [Holosporaceae bacterium]
MSQKQLNWAIIAGHMVECFDATIYGFYAVILAPYFFPPSMPQIILSFIAFSAGFVARPLGALFFGFLGDKYGRKKPLLASMALVGIPTIVIGVLPTYYQIGLWAPCVLFFCRLAQGFFYGAEFAGVSIYTFESYEKSGVLGQKTGILVASGSMGAVLATGLGAFFTMNTMHPQAWRIPFVCGGIAAFAIFLWRRQMKETKAFEDAQKKKKLLTIPTMNLWHYRSEMLVSLFIVSLNTLPLYLVTVFGNHMFREFGYSPSQSMLLNMSALVFDSIMIVIYGRLADKTGFEKQIIWGCLWMFCSAIPSFYLVSSAPSLLTIYLFMILISTGNTLVVACTMPYISTFFPTNCRFSAVALSSTLGTALIAGHTPAIAAYLIKVTNLKIAPAFWLMGISLVTLYGIYWLKQKKQKGSELNALDFVEAK